MSRKKSAGATNQVKPLANLGLGRKTTPTSSTVLLGDKLEIPSAGRASRKHRDAVLLERPSDFTGDARRLTIEEIARAVVALVNEQQDGRRLADTLVKPSSPDVGHGVRVLRGDLLDRPLEPLRLDCHRPALPVGDRPDTSAYNERRAARGGTDAKVRRLSLASHGSIVALQAWKGREAAGKAWIRIELVKGGRWRIETSWLSPIAAAQELGRGWRRLESGGWTITTCSGDLPWLLENVGRSVHAEAS